MNKTTMTYEVVEMADMIRSIQGACEFVAGCSADSSEVERVSREWCEAGFEPARAAKWWDAGVFTPEAASELLAADLAPNVVKGHKIDGYSVGYRFANKDIALPTLLRVIAE